MSDIGIFGPGSTTFFAALAMILLGGVLAALGLLTAAVRSWRKGTRFTRDPAAHFAVGSLAGVALAFALAAHTDRIGNEAGAILDAWLFAIVGGIVLVANLIDAKDPYTCGHSDRVARISVRLAQELGCDLPTVHTMYMAGLVHDIGKIGIADCVLRKPGRLTEAEFEHIKLHPELGYKILKDIRQLADVLPVVLHHHEQWDGRGYPHGLAGEQIPLREHILHTLDRVEPHARALGADAAIDQLRHCADRGANDARWLRETQSHERLLAEMVRQAAERFRGRAARG